MGALSQHFDELKESHLKEIEALKQELLHTQMELSEIKSKYDQLCGKIKHNANDKRNEGERFLSNYARDRNGPWN